LCIWFENRPVSRPLFTIWWTTRLLIQKWLLTDLHKRRKHFVSLWCQRHGRNKIPCRKDPTRSMLFSNIARRRRCVTISSTIRCRCSQNFLIPSLQWIGVRRSDSKLLLRFRCSWCLIWLIWLIKDKQKDQIAKSFWSFFWNKKNRGSPGSFQFSFSTTISGKQSANSGNDHFRIKRLPSKLKPFFK